MFHWIIVYTTFGLYRLNNVLHVFSSWLHGVNKKLARKKKTLVVWLCFKRHYDCIWLSF